jgi:hypothetical protein
LSTFGENGGGRRILAIMYIDSTFQFKATLYSRNPVLPEFHVSWAVTSCTQTGINALEEINSSNFRAENRDNRF